MPQYSTREINGAFWVIDNLTNEPIKSGPYKNEESAKRRIRDLKRKDAAEQDAGNANATEAATEYMPAPVASDGTRMPSPQRQAGCYPHISKRAYRR